MKAIADHPHTGWHFSRRTFELIYWRDGIPRKRISEEYLAMRNLRNLLESLK